MKINLDKMQIRTFGIGLAVLLTVLALWKFYKGHQTVAFILFLFGALSAVLALFCQPLLKPVYIVFIRISHVVGWINTRVLLALIYYIIITPLGIVIRIFGKDLLDRKIEPFRQSYWIKRKKVAVEKSRYEKQY
jgi:hypothetical protein